MTNPGSLVLEVSFPEAISTEEISFEVTLKATIFENVIDLPPVGITIDDVCTEKILLPVEDEQECGDAGQYSVVIELNEYYDTQDIPVGMIPPGLGIQSQILIMDKEGNKLADCDMEATVI